jgi:hypothetical protein
MTDAVETALDRAIVVVGAPRSGTTLLGNLLAHHPQLAHLQEPRLTWRYGNDGKSDRLLAEDARPDVCRRIRANFAAAVKSQGRSRLVEKTPSNALRMEFVERVLPGCLFVHIIRDGVESTLAIRKFWQQHAHGLRREKLWERLREVSPRQLPHYAREFVRRVTPRPLRGFVKPSVWGPRIPGIDGLLQDLTLIEVCALQWRMCVEAACTYGRTLPADRYLEVRLEDMSPELLTAILAFCQLDPSAEVMDALRRDFDKSQTSHRRGEALPEDIERVRQWVEPTLTWLQTIRS